MLVFIDILIFFFYHCNTTTSHQRICYHCFHSELYFQFIICLSWIFCLFCYPRYHCCYSCYPCYCHNNHCSCPPPFTAWLNFCQIFPHPPMLEAGGRCSFDLAAPVRSTCPLSCPSCHLSLTTMDHPSRTGRSDKVKHELYMMDGSHATDSV